MIVIDASALIAFFLREEGWERLVNYMKIAMSVDHAVKEFYNAVWKAVYIKKFISFEEAIKIINLFKEYCARNLIIESENKYIDDAFKISIQKGIPIYDALYIAQAIRNNKPLLTLDTKQGNIARKLGVVKLP